MAIEHPGLNGEKFDALSEEIDAELKDRVERLVKRYALSIWQLGHFFYHEWKKAEKKLPFELPSKRFEHLF